MPATKPKKPAAKPEKVVMPKPKEWAKGLREDVASRQTASAQRKEATERAGKTEQAMLVEAFAPIRRYIEQVRKEGVSVPAPDKNATDYSYQTSSRWVFFTLDDDIEVTAGFGVRVVSVGWAGEKRPQFEVYTWDGEAAQNQFYRRPEPDVHTSAKAALKSFMDHLQSHISLREAPSV